MIIDVCVGSSCHQKGSYEVIKSLQDLIEKNNLKDKVELKNIKGIIVPEKYMDYEIKDLQIISFKSISYVNIKHTTDNIIKYLKFEGYNCDLEYYNDILREKVSVKRKADGDTFVVEDFTMEEIRTGKKETPESENVESMAKLDEVLKKDNIVSEPEQTEVKQKFQNSSQNVKNVARNYRILKGYF